MWPPKRPSAFIGNSRFTRAPSCIRENEVRAHVSGARSAQNVFGLMSSAVRQTPLTATLSPTPNCFEMVAASTVIRRFSPRCWIFTTLPTSSIIPVNMGSSTSLRAHRYQRITIEDNTCHLYDDCKVEQKSLHRYNDSA